MQRFFRLLGVTQMLFSGGTFVIAGARAGLRGAALWLFGTRADGRVVGVGEPCVKGPGECLEFAFTDAEGGTRALQSQVPGTLSAGPGDQVKIWYTEDDAEAAGLATLATFGGLFVAGVGVLVVRTGWSWRRGNRGA